MSVSKTSELLEHLGHEIEIVSYGDIDCPRSVTIECIDCGEVLLEPFGGTEENG